MKPEETDSTWDAALVRLPVRDARPERVAQIREACLAALALTRERRAARRQVRDRWRTWLEEAAATGLAALLLAAAVERALQVLR